ncbi:MAG: hypothetical protein WCF67_02105 [Chitinophagaceae bacterium]
MLKILCFLLAWQLQDPSASIKQIDDQLSKGTTSINSVLSNQTYLKLHPLDAFRNVIKKHAKTGSLLMVTKDEPGVAVTINGKLVSGNRPLANTLVYVYHTDHVGSYGDAGNSHPVLFGYLKTNEKGEFRFETIRPASYPNSNIQQHVHLEAYDAGGRSLTVTELLFDDDPVLKGSARTNSVNAGFFIAKNSGTKDKQVFSYTVNVK